MKLFAKIFVYSLGLTLLPLLVVALLASRGIHVVVQERTYVELEQRAALLRQVAEDAWGETTLQSRVRRLDPRSRYTVIQSDGVVLADSAKDPAAMESHAGRAEFVQAATQPYGRAERHSATLGRGTVYVATKIVSDGRPVGFARVSVTSDAVAQSSRAMGGWLVSAFVISLLLSTLLAYVVARKRSRTLARMSETAEAIVEGDYQRRVASPLPSDELGDLGRSFNSMAENLESRLEAITRERRRLDTVLAGMVEGVVAVDADERIVHCNAAAHSILGLAEASPVGQPVWEAIRLPQVPDSLRKAAQTNAPLANEMTVVRDGSVAVVKLHAAPLRSRGEREAEGAVLVLHDMTELRRLEDVRRDFVANASHELKTPVAAIRGMVETILGDEDMVPHDRSRFLSRVLVQTERLQHLVEEMLELSRLEAADRLDRGRAVDARIPVQEAVDAVAPLAAERSVALTCTLPPEEALVHGRNEALRRIAGNLLDNAVKYTPKGGRVGLALLVTDEWLVLEISDTGAGIPAGKEDRIFERFYRIDEGRDREAGGTGLGLAIVKHLVMSMAGHVSLETREGEGSRFSVRLPRA